MIKDMNEELLLQYNKVTNNTKISICNGCAIYKNNARVFDGNVIRDILSFVSTLHSKYRNINIPISFELGSIIFKDKLTYIFLESICFLLIEYYNHNVYVKFLAEPNIFTNGINSSPLLLLTTNEKKHREKFICKYTFDIYKDHYRRLLSSEDMKNEKLSIIMDEIVFFLNHFEVDDQYLDDICEVIIELIGNVSEHTNANCLIDIDIADSYNKRNEPGRFYGINLNIVNFSECLFGDLIRERILYDDISEFSRYQLVRNAYDYHKGYFSESYTENDFFNIVAFQHKISGNTAKVSTGGTGLTKLICSLEKCSDSHNCYLISGDRALWFFHELLEYNRDNWIGFNQEKDFITHLPEMKTVGSNTIFMPGTAFNLNFVMKRRESN